MKALFLILTALLVVSFGCTASRAFVAPTELINK